MNEDALPSAEGCQIRVVLLVTVSRTAVEYPAAAVRCRAAEAEGFGTTPAVHVQGPVPPGCRDCRCWHRGSVMVVDDVGEPRFHDGGLGPARFTGGGRVGSVQWYTGEVEILAQQGVADEAGPVAPDGVCFGELGDVFGVVARPRHVGLPGAARRPD